MFTRSHLVSAIHRLAYIGPTPMKITNKVYTCIKKNDRKTAYFPVVPNLKTTTKYFGRKGSNVVPSVTRKRFMSQNRKKSLGDVPNEQILLRIFTLLWLPLKRMIKRQSFIVQFRDLVKTLNLIFRFIQRTTEQESVQYRACTWCV